MSTVEKALEIVIEGVVRRVVREELAAARAAPMDEMVTIETFARMRAISKSTVRAAIRGGRLQATRIGRAVRVRSDAQIGESVAVVAAVDTPAARAMRILGGRS
jgi:excisionase family DNA binding protein